jgi:hypothetical protein
MNVPPAAPPVQHWTWIRWLVAIAIVFVLHVMLIFIFGAHKPVRPEPVVNAPSLALASGANSWLDLNNATLFALPDQNGFAGEMWAPILLPLHQHDWTEEPHWLAGTNSLPVSELGARFDHFVQTNVFAEVALDFTLSPPLASPVVPPPAPPQGSSLRIEGDIVKRPMLNTLSLPSWPYADVIAPSVVQVLVDAAGNVVSATLLPPDSYLEPSALGDSMGPSAVRYAEADQRAVELARSARFAPLSPDAGSIEANPLAQLTVGRLIFDWETLPATNANGH